MGDIRQPSTAGLSPSRLAGLGQVRGQTAQRILLAEAGKLGVRLGRSEVLRRRAHGGPPVHVMAAADELVRHLGAEADPLGEHSSLMVLARAGALALMNRTELTGSVQAQPAY